ncbi:MAG: hypothetical protein C4576_07780 [Desulfobacteraceae bacterium]|nr:MAG: hypothetical protein C4576_07780 [Desulfobacteraceae bacterium]
MKCPKCSYVSFDYNQSCPKCHKDLGAEQQKLNIPAFKPEPPSLLGGLLGDQAQPEHDPNEPAEEAAHEVHSLDDATVQMNEPFLNDSQEIDLQEEKEDLGLESIASEESAPEIEMGALDMSGAEKESASSGESGIEGTISLEDADVFPPEQAKKEAAPTEISLDLEEITLDLNEPGGTKQEANKADQGLEIDLGDFSLEDEEEKRSQVSAGASEEPVSYSAAGSEENPPESKESEEITLTLDDLKVNNETGQLEIGKFIPGIAGKKAQAKVAESTLNLKKSPLAGAETQDELSLLLGDDAIEIPAAAEGVESLDLENLDLELDLDGPDQK